MENNKRAEQFLPFDALKGFKEAIKEKEKVIVDKIELSEENERKINYYLNQIKVGKMVEIIYFKNKEYIKINGLITHIDYIEKYLRIVKTKIYFKDIYSIDSTSFVDFD